MTDPNYGALDGLRVKHGSLEAAAAAMYETAKRMNDRLDRLESEVKPHVDTWAHDSEQRLSYDQAKAAWDWAMRELLDLLDGVSNTTYQSNANYMQADKRGAARIQQGG